MDPHTNLVVQGAIARITLNRPEAYNALDLATAKELSRHLLAISSDDSLRGVVITGAGKTFSAGGDIKRAAEHPRGSAAAFHELATFVHVCIVEIRRMRKPVIAAVNGIAAGGGFSLALACDFRVMGRTATLKQAFTSNGLSIDAGGTYTLPRLVGFARALEIAAFDKPISADHAAEWGLVTKVVPDAAVLSEAMEMAETLASRSLHSFAWSKALLSNAFESCLEAHLERERQGLVSCVAHPDGQEGMRAFLEKRQPVYSK